TARSCLWLNSFFFFQAEDGIRDFHVTGVQTCALPILLAEKDRRVALNGRGWYQLDRIDGEEKLEMLTDPQVNAMLHLRRSWVLRSEERRAGEEGRAPWLGAPCSMERCRRKLAVIALLR